MLHLETTTALDGDTTHGSNVSKGSCVGADAPEVIFQLVSQHSGSLAIGVPANHGVYVRSDCVNESSELACSDGSKGNGTISLPITSGVPITIVVDALDALHPGAFHVPLTFTQVGCGDGVRQDPEECDDGVANGTPTDGCSATCTAVPAILCQSFPTAMLGQTPGDFQHGTKSFVGPCVGTFDTPEQGYRYVPSSTSVTVSVDSTATVGVYGRNGPCPGTTSLGCSVGNAQFGAPSIKMATQPGQEITFFVELAPSQPVNATYTLSVTEP
jgi:cysteine-rich repeat protein